MSEDRLRRAVSEEINWSQRMLSEAWGYFLRRWAVWLAAACLNLAIAVGIVVGSFLTSFEFNSWLTLLVLAAPIGLFAGGLCRMAIKQVRGEDIALADAFQLGPESPQLLGASVMLACMAVPALILGGLENLLLTFPLIVDQKMSIGDALSESWRTLSRAQLPWGATGILAVLLAFLLFSIGGIALVVGFPITVPLFWLWVAVVYRDCYA